MFKKFINEVAKSIKEEVKETRNELINRYLKHYKVKYIKDLDEVGKKFLDTALQSKGYKITSKRMLKGEQWK